MSVIIQKIGRLRPRDSIFYFRGKKELWRKLRSGEEIKVPEDVALMCKGVVVKGTVKDIVDIKQKKKKTKDIKGSDD